MYDWVPAVAIVGIVLITGATVVLRGPVGTALAEWIRGWSKTDQQWLAVQAAKHDQSWLAAYAPKANGVTAGELAQVLSDLDQLRQRLAEVEERLDFTERLLAQERQADRLAPPR
jgi:hypothetical protein